MMEETKDNRNRKKRNREIFLAISHLPSAICHLISVRKEGLRYFGTLFILAAISLLFNIYITIFFGVIALFVLFFFRDPERKVAIDEDLVLSPADGRVLDLARGVRCNFLEGDATLLRIFLSIFNVHIQRAPVSGRIERIEHKSGKYHPAMKGSAEDENSQNMILMKDSRKDRGFFLKQIAGILARRIHFWKREEESVVQGERIGLIEFGSQVVIYLPSDIDICVKEGDRVKAGLSVIARYQKKE